ncbi:MAG: sulfite exporter TauE/SafE family protein [Spirochaetia bacterium]
MSLEFWFMLPVSVVIASIAMASGVEGATFFTPLFILALGLPTEVAVGVGLITEVFGFGSGLLSYARKKLIDYKLGLTMLMVTVPLALAGTWLARYVPPSILKSILGVGLLLIATTFLKSPHKETVKLLDQEIGKSNPTGRATTTLVTRDGEEISYTVCNRLEGGVLGGIGALFIGMISTVLGEMNGYFLLQRCKVPSRVSVATSVFIVSVTALVASAGHFVGFLTAGPETLSLVSSIVIFTIPGVVIGGQIGPLIASRIPQRALEVSLAVLFILVAALMLANVLLG